ncbi:histone deacetylase family protein [Kordiimonas aestuarii]|uniref:histone deacetylase family protein n=1 Tax=Kordiimonas aestuarii TaxID=1005925 RepID=UPI0021D2E9A7|nr:histone deacetylase family protein [Kordiimonas aestuarii]
MKAFFSQKQAAHFPEHFLVNGVFRANPEHPDRATRLGDGVVAAGCEVLEPRDHGMGAIAKVHSPEYLAFLKNAYKRWSYIDGASAAVVPDIRPVSRSGGYPASVVAQAGYHMSDASSPITADTWDSICWSAWSAVEAAEVVLAGENLAYALCRPPGHHAGQDIAGGFCYFNNSAIAATHLQSRFPRVAILDVDLHHGNGTQQIFYNRADVLTVSLHADPVRFYPFFWGHSAERGAGEGLGYNLNLPLPRATGDTDYLKSLKVALGRIEAFAPDALVVALGIDASADDPFGGLAVTPDGFGGIGKAIADSIVCPTVIVQEGGYLSDTLSLNLTRFLQGMQSN